MLNKLNGEKSDPGLPFERKCDLLGVSRSTAYSKQKSVVTKRHEEDVELVKEIEAVYAKSPFFTGVVALLLKLTETVVKSAENACKV